MSIGNLSQSSAHGFNDTTINTIPLTMSGDHPSVGLTISLGLQFQIALEIDFFDGDDTVSAGMNLDLPILEVTAESISSVDSKCIPTSKNSTTESTGDFFSDLIHIIPGVQLAIELQAKGQVDAPDLATTLGATITIAQTTYNPFPTACLSYDASKKAFVSPTPTPSSSSNGGSSNGGPSDGGSSDGGKSKNSAGVQRHPPSGADAVICTGGMLLGVLFVALSL